MKDFTNLSIEELYTELQNVNNEVLILQYKCKNGLFTESRKNQLNSLMQKNKRVRREIGKRNRIAAQQETERQY